MLQYDRSNRPIGSTFPLLLAFEKSRTKKIDLDKFVVRLDRKHPRLPLLKTVKECDVFLKQFRCNFVVIFQHTSSQLKSLRVKHFSFSHTFVSNQTQIFFISYSPYHAQACDALRGQSPQLSAWATYSSFELRKNMAAVASRWRLRVSFDQRGNRTQTSRTGSNIVTTTPTDYYGSCFPIPTYILIGNNLVRLYHRRTQGKTTVPCHPPFVLR